MSSNGATPNGNATAEKTEFEIFNEKIELTKLPLISRSQLSLYDGVQKPQLYVAIRGYVYDVTENSKNYGPGKSYNKLVGKDVTRLLGLNKLQLSGNEEDASDLKNTTWYSGDFDDKQNGIVDKWILFFRKRYRIVAVVVNHDMSA